MINFDYLFFILGMFVGAVSVITYIILNLYIHGYI